MFLSDNEIRLRIERDVMIEGYGDLEEQLQPNGFDIRLAKVEVMSGRGSGLIGRYNKHLPTYIEIPSEDDSGGRDVWYLEKGAYLVTFAETVNIPMDALALGRPRSTLLRCGVSLHTGVWDAGYSGKSQSLLTVHANHGVVIEKKARIMQLVFAFLDKHVNKSYDGSYQFEGLDHYQKLYGLEEGV